MAALIAVAASLSVFIGVPPTSALRADDEQDQIQQQLNEDEMIQSEQQAEQQNEAAQQQAQLDEQMAQSDAQPAN
jgi:hypothetical protein